MLHLKEGFKGERSIILPPLIVDFQKEDPLVSSLYITDIGYYPNAEHHYCERKEPIAQNVLLYCVEGCGHYRLHGKENMIRKNQYIILPANELHAYWSDEKEPWTIYWIHFSGAHSKYYVEGADTPKDVQPGITSRINDRNNIFEEIFYTISSGYSQENLRYASSLLHYYLGSMRFLQQYRKADKHEDKMSPTSIVDIAKHYMNENIENTLSLELLSKQVGYSASHLSAVFKAETSESPLHYFNAMKIQRACLLLEETDMKINQICHKIGISDCYYFSRLFKKHTGSSPKAYRDLHKENSYPK